MNQERLKKEAEDLAREYELLGFLSANVERDKLARVIADCIIGAVLFGLVGVFCYFVGWPGVVAMLTAFGIALAWGLGIGIGLFTALFVYMLAKAKSDEKRQADYHERSLKALEQRNELEDVANSISRLSAIRIGKIADTIEAWANEQKAERARVSGAGVIQSKDDPFRGKQFLYPGVTDCPVPLKFDDQVVSSVTTMKIDSAGTVTGEAEVDIELAERIKEKCDQIDATIGNPWPLAAGFFSWNEPTPGQLSDACMSYDHGYGLMPAAKRMSLNAAAINWLRAWRKVFMEPSYIQKSIDAQATPEPAKMDDGKPRLAGYWWWRYKKLRDSKRGLEWTDQ